MEKFPSDFSYDNFRIYFKKEENEKSQEEYLKELREKLVNLVKKAISDISSENHLSSKEVRIFLEFPIELNTESKYNFMREVGRLFPKLYYRLSDGFIFTYFSYRTPEEYKEATGLYIDLD